MQKTLALSLTLAGIVSVIVGLYSVRHSSRTPEDVKTEGYWKGLRSSDDFGSKFVLPSKFLVDYLGRENVRRGYVEIPTSDGITPDDLTLFKGLVEKLPKQFLKSLNEKIVGITVVNHLGSSGFSQVVRSGDFADRGFIVIDKKVLSTPADEWMTYRESSPFNCGGEDRIEAVISDHSPTSEAAVDYFFLHEAAHVLSAGTYLTPADESVPNQASLAETEFSPLSWRVNSSKYLSLDEAKFSLREKVKYYAPSGSRLDCGKALQVYDELKETNFPALYAASDPFEDFAESFANFYHSRVLKRPFEIKIFKKNALSKTYKACWEEKRCEKKRIFLDAFVRSVDQYIRKK